MLFSFRQQRIFIGVWNTLAVFQYLFCCTLALRHFCQYHHTFTVWPHPFFRSAYVFLTTNNGLCFLNLILLRATVKHMRDFGLSPAPTALQEWTAVVRHMVNGFWTSSPSTRSTAQCGQVLHCERHRRLHTGGWDCLRSLQNARLNSHWKRFLCFIMSFLVHWWKKATAFPMTTLSFKLPYVTLRTMHKSKRRRVLERPAMNPAIYYSW